MYASFLTCATIAYSRSEYRLMSSTLWLSVGLVVASVVLVSMHLAAWRAADHGGLTDRDSRYYARQYRRRTLASTLLGISGLLLGCESLFTNTTTKAFYLLGVCSVVMATMVLALADWLATRKHYAVASRNTAAEHALLKAEIERYHRESSEPTDSQ